MEGVYIIDDGIYELSPIRLVVMGSIIYILVVSCMHIYDSVARILLP